MIELLFSLLVLNPDSSPIQGGVHLRKWKRVTFTFEYVVQKAGYDITRVEAFAAKAPNTGTQMNCSTEIVIKARNPNQPVPEGSLESSEQVFKTSEGNQRGIYAQYKNKEKQLYRDGYTITICYKADLYQYVSLPNSTLTTIQGKYPPTSLADFTKPIVADWGNRCIAPVPSPDPAFSSAAGVIKAIRESGVKYFGEDKVKSASELLTKKGGDCGSITNLFVAGVLGSGYNARTIVGWNIEEGKPKRHARAEVAARGSWAPVDATFALDGGDPLSYVGDGAVTSNQNFFTFHFGMIFRTIFKDASGEYRTFADLNLQRPEVVFSTSDAPRSDRVWLASGSNRPSVSYETF